MDCSAEVAATGTGCGLRDLRGLPSGPARTGYSRSVRGTRARWKRAGQNALTKVNGGAPGATRTHTGRILSPLPLPIGLRGLVGVSILDR